MEVGLTLHMDTPHVPQLVFPSQLACPRVPVSSCAYRHLVRGGRQGLVVGYRQTRSAVAQEAKRLEFFGLDRSRFLTDLLPFSSRN